LKAGDVVSLLMLQEHIGLWQEFLKYIKEKVKNPSQVFYVRSIVKLAISFGTIESDYQFYLGYLSYIKNYFINFIVWIMTRRGIWSEE